MQGGWGTLLDASLYTGVNRKSLSKDIRRGLLLAYRIGGRKCVRLRRTDCDRYVEASAIAVPVRP